MFWNCGNLKKIDLSGFVGEVLTDISLMFLGCENLTLIDMRNFECEKCDETNDMFKYISTSGNFIYNSSKINTKILEELPVGWNKTDTKN